MLFSEFQENTGCRDNPQNHQLYRELEIIYMNTDCSKEHIYDMGKKLMDNSKTEEEIRLEKEIKAEIEQHKGFAKDYGKQIELEKSLPISNKEYIKYCRSMMKYHKQRICELKWILD
jgi:hypothetical protein